MCSQCFKAGSYTHFGRTRCSACHADLDSVVLYHYEECDRRGIDRDRARRIWAAENDERYTNHGMVKR